MLYPPTVFCQQNIVVLLQQAERLEKTNQEAAFSKYQEIIKLQPTHLKALIKCSEMCSSIGHRQENKENKISYFKAARKFAEIALRLHPNDAEANFVMSIAMGRMALISSGKQKIEAVNDIKKYAELSIKNDPNNFKAYHVLGRWHYEVSNLGAVERTAAKILYGGLPPASLTEAIAYYEKSKALNAAFALNYLELGKAYYRNHQKEKAMATLSFLSTIANTTVDDTRVKAEGKKLMLEWARVIK
jgi:tetratricopeptide (TPR) repeat protein